MYEIEAPSGENIGPPRKPGDLETSSGWVSRLSRRRMYTGPGKGVNARCVPSGEIARCELNPGGMTWPSGRSIVKREIRRSPGTLFADNDNLPPTARANTENTRLAATSHFSFFGCRLASRGRSRAGAS